MTGSNRRPPACKAGALPAELILQRIYISALISVILNTHNKLFQIKNPYALYKRLIRGFIHCLATSYSHRDKVPTTIGAKELNFRVRYGNGCDLFAIATRQEIALSKLDNSWLSKAYAFKSLVKSSID